jgi:septum formation protein
LVLASASPRRLELLRGAGLEPLVRVPRVDESPRPAEPAHLRVARLATEKARAVASDLRASIARAVVLGADTEVVIDGFALGKPRDAAEAREMLRRLSGRTHEVLTGVHVLRLDDPRSTTAVEVTRVTFAAFDDSVAREYALGDEPLDKAGAYAIQGDGARLVSRVDGSLANVVGLPVERLDLWLERIGLVRSDLDSSAGSA